MIEVTDKSAMESRFNAALQDLPVAFPTTREKSAMETLSNHAVSLRSRLDFLVRQEDELGERQRNVHRRRAERNALIWTLEELVPGGKPENIPKTRVPNRDYVRRCSEQAIELMDQGFVRALPERPGQLFHRLGDDIVPTEVSLPVWFYVRGLNESGEALTSKTE